MWLLADLFQDLPEVGELDKPKLVFFFDEAHLLFKDASKEFLESITQTVRLIRSKGVGVFFVTQTPKDVHSDVLAQLGNRVQHALRPYTPDDAKALKATASTFPNSAYVLEEALIQLGAGEAMVTVLSEHGAPTPVAWTRLRAPQSLMAAADTAAMESIVRASSLHARYAEPVDRESAYEKLTEKLTEKLNPQAPVEKSKPGAGYPQQEPGMVEKVLTSSAAKSFFRAAATATGGAIARQTLVPPGSGAANPELAGHRSGRRIALSRNKFGTFAAP
ncbi:helicase HerA-like domain-containing protein [Micromonospora sp. CPCC 206061]|uniref:helicase HerA-like domain-containing protein n=1 Tax=Micromonospora sp. CPCC 206061 TaxID=3122410 RepID=UPI002FF099A2